MRAADLSIGQRLGIGFGVVLILLVVQAGVTLAFVSHTRALQREKESVFAPGRDAAETMHDALMQQDRGLHAFLLTGEPARLGLYRKASAEADGRWEELVRLHTGTDAARLAEIGMLSRGYHTRADAMLALVRSGANESALRAHEEGLSSLREELLARVLAFAQRERREYRAAEAGIVRARQRMSRWILGLAALLLASTALTALLTTGAIRRPVGRLLKAARALEAGDYQAALAPGDGSDKAGGSARERPRDELQELTGAFRHMARALHTRELRLDADARVARVLGSSIRAEQISEDALREIAAHAGCEVGAFYVYDRPSGLLRCAAGYALDGRPESFPFENGIPGQALRERQCITVRDIPADTPFRICLGFDSVPPRTIVAAPTYFGEEPIGVAVLGSLRDVGEQEMDFIRHSAVQLGVSLRNALTHEEVARLAAELQEKNEALEAQNEEIQAQNEELQAQGEEIQAQNEEMQAQSEEIHAQNDELLELNETVRDQLRILERTSGELERRNQALAEADRQKNEFVAMLAHELRNPLAAIANASYLLGRSVAGEPRMAAPQAIIARQTGHLARLVDDLLDVSRISRGAIELRRERVDLGDVVKRAVEAMRALIHGRGHHLSVELPDTSLPVNGDPARLQQVLTNLLCNAAKYTPAGGRVTVSAERAGESAILRVQDTGRGIPPEMLPRIFDLFVQADHSLDRSEGGLGIGLTLVRRLVELHGGEVNAHSDGADKGSAFAVCLPLASPADLGESVPGPDGVGGTPKESPTSALPWCVLVVDDNRDAANTLAEVLELSGHGVCIAYDGPSAIEMARERHPDAVLLDIGLPGMDGCEVARRLRLEAGVEPALLAAVTGYGDDAMREQCEDAGFDCHLTKPLDIDEVCTLLNGLRTPG